MMRGRGGQAKLKLQNVEGQDFGVQSEQCEICSRAVEAAKIVNSVLTLQIFIAGRSWAAHLKAWHSEAVSFM